MRLFAMLLLAGGFPVLGVCGACRLKRRTRELREVILGLETIRREMKYSLAPLPLLLKCAAEQTAGEVKVLFGCCAEKIAVSDGNTFRQVFPQVLEQCNLCLRQTELLLLRTLGGVLGSYDADEQICALENMTARLEAQYDCVVEESVRLGRLYTVLGVAAGMFTFILFI